MESIPQDVEQLLHDHLTNARRDRLQVIVENHLKCGSGSYSELVVAWVEIALHCKLCGNLLFHA